MCKDILQCPLPEATGCASAADHLVPHDITIVPPETQHTLPNTLFFPYPHQVPNKVHLPCVEHMLVTVVYLSEEEEEENFNKLFE